VSLKRILIAGEGGQGIQALAKILVGAAFADGKKVTFLPNFGVEQRGGVSLAYIQISDGDISFPKFQKADIVVCLAERAVRRIEEYLWDDTVFLFDNSLIQNSVISHLKVEKLAIPASHLAKEKLIPKVFNIIMLGALVREIGDLKWKTMEGEIVKVFAEKIKEEPQLKHFNLVAFEMGEDMVKGLRG
jgi:2-oxoglutarate ferredoxin oxidoreductase subunit gamma